MTTKEVAKYEAAVTTSMQAMTVMRETLAPGESFDMTDLQRVKVPSGGGKNWELPDGSAAPKISGVIVVRQPVRAFWKERFSETGGGTPPDCTSDDLTTGIGDNGQEQGTHSCLTCPMAQFGSAVNDKGEPGLGQACQQITRLFMLREGQMLPLLVSVPPSSAKACKQFAIHTASAGLPLWSVETELGLNQVKSQGGITYSKVTFKALRALEGAELEAVDRYRREFAPVLAQTVIDATE